MPTTKKFLDSDGLVQYTTLVKREISNAADDHKVKHNSESGTATLPILTSHQSNPSDGNNYEAGYDTALSYKPHDKEVTVTSGNNVATISPTEVKVKGEAGMTTITASGIALPDGAGPNITKTAASGDLADQLSVTVGGQTSSAVELTTASGSKKGVVKVDTLLKTNSTNPVQNQAVYTAFRAAEKTVRQSAQTGSTALPILVSAQASPTSGNNYEAGYDADLKYNPNTNTLTIGDGTLSPTAFSGHASATESDLSSTATDKGADMVAYTSSDSVKDALDDIYGQIGGGGGGGDSLTDRVEALEDAVDGLENNKADITAAVGSITGTNNGNESCSYTMVDGTTTGTFLYKNNKVAQEEDTTTDGSIPILLGSGIAPNSVGEKVKYNTLIGYNPSSGVFNIKNKTTPSSFIQINGDSISLYKQAGTGSVSISVDGGFTGNAASATNDGNNRNIVNTYATKQELDALSNKWTGQFHIADTLPPLSNTGDADVDANANKRYLGYIYLIRDEEHGGVNSNVFNENIVVSEYDDSEDKFVWKWELLGTTDAGVDVVSLTTAEINTIWSTTAAAS